AFRIVVNTPTTLGSIGLTTGLDPAMTLGCGGYGGNITSDNISPRHLLNIKRLAYEVTGGAAARAGTPPPAAPRAVPVSSGIGGEMLARRVNAFLGERGFTPSPTVSSASTSSQSSPQSRAASAAPATTPAPLDFVCEDDVRAAIRAGRQLVVSERAIVTP